ncbi:MAG: glycosyltransferase family 4 protein [Acidimicrobiales bacterium]
MEIHACTIIARNYLAHARVLASSFRAQHPEARFTVLVTDDRFGEVTGDGEPFEVLQMGALDIEQATLHQMIMGYGVMELATAVKPWLLRTLLARGSGVVAYFDPDIFVYQPVDDLFETASSHGIALTPHLLAPMPRDGKRPTEAEILGAGTFNLGFIAVSDEAKDFLDWWSERLRRDCRDDPANMVFTDQRWIDFVPSLFPHAVVGDQGCNVAYWNVDQRMVRRVEGQWRAGDATLRFFHFSGYSPHAPCRLSRHQGTRPRVLLSEEPDLASLCDAYGEALSAAGYDAVTPIAYGWGRLPNGIPVDAGMRRLYRQALDDMESIGWPAPPDPWAPGELPTFLAWLNEPNPHRPSLSRYAGAVYEDRPDVHTVYPDLDGSDREGFLAWLHEHGAREMGLSPRLLPENPVQTAFLSRMAPQPPAPREGVNVAGYLRAELGVGEAARLAIAAIEAVGMPHTALAYARTSSRQGHDFLQEQETAAPYDINLVCVNADQVSFFRHEAGVSFNRGGYTIGLWFWEVEGFPASLHGAFDQVDEVWVATEHVRAAIAPHTNKPVLTMPLPLVAPRVDPLITRADLGLPPDRFVFLFVFDYLSVLQRKNPLAVIEAFEMAFRPDEGPLLIIKSINGDQCPVEREQLRHAARSRPDVVLREEYLRPDEKTALMASIDCYVSLHRAEGLGLTMAEAMTLGKPVIASRYSGNLDFMNEENSFLVPTTPVAIPAGTPIYPDSTRWAEPDVAVAAQLLRRVVDDPEAAAERAERGRRDLERLHTPEICGRRMKERLEEIRGSSGRTPGQEWSARERRGVINVVEGTADGFGTGAAKRLARGGSSVAGRLASSMSARRELQAITDQLSERVDAEIMALANRIDGLALDQHRFVDAMTEQVQALTEAVNRLQLRMEDPDRMEGDSSS